MFETLTTGMSVSHSVGCSQGPRDSRSAPCYHVGSQTIWTESQNSEFAGGRATRGLGLLGSVNACPWVPEIFSAVG